MWAYAPLLLLAACSRGPDMAASSLVGNWSRWLPTSPENKSPSEIAAEQRKLLDAGGTPDTESFRADGTWVSRTGDKERRGRWKLLSEDEETIEVEMDLSEQGNPFVRTFERNAPDVYRERVKTYGPMRLVRMSGRE